MNSIASLRTTSACASRSLSSPRATQSEATFGSSTTLWIAADGASGRVKPFDAVGDGDDRGLSLTGRRHLDWVLAFGSNHEQHLAVECGEW